MSSVKMKTSKIPQAFAFSFYSKEIIFQELFESTSRYKTIQKKEYNAVGTKKIVFFWDQEKLIKFGQAWFLIMTLQFMSNRENESMRTALILR